MPYQSGTILARKVALDAPDDEIVVIGPSPVQTGARPAEWSGQLGTLLSVKPTSFGVVADRPEGELRRDYDVVSVPPPPVPAPLDLGPQTPGLSPEEVFSAAAPIAPPPVKPSKVSPEEVLTPDPAKRASMRSGTKDGA